MTRTPHFCLRNMQVNRIPLCNLPNNTYVHRGCEYINAIIYVILTSKKLKKIKMNFLAACEIIEIEQQPINICCTSNWVNRCALQLIASKKGDENGFTQTDTHIR